MNRYNDNSNDNSSNFNDNFDNQDSYHHRRRSPSNFRGSGGGGGGGGEGGHRPFNSPPRQYHSSAGAGGGFRPIGGGGGGGGGGGFRPIAGGFEANYPPPQPHPPLQTHMGQKRAFPFSGGGGSSANSERFGGAGSGGKFAKLFVGSVPRTAAEKDIQDLFEEHGDVIEVALIKDKKTGQPQGCCFIKYATLEEADRAIRALHNQHTLPGGVGPIQVRYADGERERLGAIEYKLFVGSLNKQATEIDVQEIFSRFGRVEDVYLMRDELKQSRGCGFVKYSDREMALAAIDALNGVYTMRGCDQSLTVRFADPKRPRQAAGDLRGGTPFSRGVAPAFGGPGFGPRFQAPGPKPAPNFGDAMGDCVPPTAWRPMSPQNMGPTSNPGIRSMGSQLLPRSGDPSIPLNPGGPFGGPSDGSLPGIGVSSSSTSQQGFNQPSSQVPTGGQQISPLQKHLQSPKHLPSSFQLHPLAAVSYSQTQTAQVGQLQVPVPAIHTPFSQALPSHLVGLSGQLPASQPQAQQNALSAAALQNPLNVSLPPNLQPNSAPITANQQQFPVPIQQKLLQPLKQSPSQLAQMLSQQTQTLQASFQTSQQAFSQLQQQLHLIQPSNQNMTLQQSSQASKQQWAGMTQQTVGSTPANAPGTDVPSSVSNPAAPIMTPAVASVECHWTEHTSPDGFKYYHNSLTRESKWEKPEELILFEQQQQQQKPPVQQPQTQSHPAQQASQQVQLQTRFQTQIQHPPQLHQQPLFPTSYPASGVRNQQNTQELGYGQLPVAPSSNDPTRFQQGIQTMQDLVWKNKP